MFNFNRKPKSPGEQDKDRRNALIAATGLAAVGAAAAYEELPDLNASHATNAPATAEAPANNPTLGKHAGDAPEKVVIPAPKAESGDPVVIDLAEKQVVVDFTEDDQQIVTQPEI